MIKNAIPYHVMTRLICGFKMRDFNLKYVKEFSCIKAGNRDVNKKDSLAKDHSIYWLMNQKGSFVVMGCWDKQKDRVVQEDQHIYLQSILASLTDAVKILLEKMDYATRIPGFV